MYLGNVLLRKHVSIILNDNKLTLRIPRGEGPDFFADGVGYIECVAPTRGAADKGNSVPAAFIAPSSKEIQVQDLPSDQIILRITSTFFDKAVTKYIKLWKGKTWFNSDIPFIVAINTGGLGYLDTDIPHVIKALFGVEHPGSTRIREVSGILGEILLERRKETEK